MRLPVFAAAALCAISLAARADTVYDYVGQDFQYVYGSHTTMDKVTGSFTVVNPIAPGYSGIVHVISFSFNDGVDTLTDVNTHFRGFMITTDSSGNITNYSIDLGAPRTPTNFHLNDEPSSLGGDAVYDDNGSTAYNFLPGEFTEQNAVSPTPEPYSFALLGTGLLGIAGVVRRRFA